MGPAPLWEGGAEGKERFPHSVKPCHRREDHLGQRGSFGDSKDSAASRLWQARQSKTYMDGSCCSPACSSLSCESAGVERGWVLGCGVWRVDPGRGQLLAMNRQLERTGVRRSTTGKVCGRSLNRHSSRVPLLNSAQGAGWPLQPSSPCIDPASVSIRRGTHLSSLTHPAPQSVLWSWWPLQDGLPPLPKPPLTC